MICMISFRMVDMKRKDVWHLCYELIFRCLMMVKKQWRERRDNHSGRFLTHALAGLLGGSPFSSLRIMILITVIMIIINFIFFSRAMKWKCNHHLVLAIDKAVNQSVINFWQLENKWHRPVESDLFHVNNHALQFCLICGTLNILEL